MAMNTFGDGLVESIVAVPDAAEVSLEQSDLTF